MEHDPINIDEFSIPKDNVLKETIMRTTTLVEMRGATTPLQLTPLKVIVSVATWFKRKKVSIHVKFSVVALAVKVFPVMTILMSSPLISVVETSLVVGTFI